MPPHNLDVQLSAYLDGELSEQETRDVESWLAESADARRHLEELRSISRGLAALPRSAAPMPLDAWARSPVPLGPNSLRRRMILVFSRVSAAAALIALGMFAAWMLPPHSLSTTTRIAPSTEDMALQRVHSAAESPPGTSAGSGSTQTAEPERIVPELAEKSAYAARRIEPGPSPPAVTLGGEAADKVETLEYKAGVPATNKVIPAPVSALAAAASADLNVVIAPQTAEQYDQVRNAFFAWNNQRAEGRKLGRDISRSAAREEDQSASPGSPPPANSTPVSIVAQPEQLGRLIRSLEEEANAGDLRIRLDFRPSQISQVQTMFSKSATPLAGDPPAAMPAEPPPAVDQSPVAANTRKLDALGYAAAKDDAEQDSSASKTPAGLSRDDPEAADERNRAVAGRAGGPARSKTRELGPPARAPLSQADAVDTATDLKKESSGLTTESDRNAGLRLEADESAVAPATADAPATSQNGVTALLDQIRGAASTIGQRVDGYLRFALGRLEEEAARRAQLQQDAETRLGLPGTTEDELAEMRVQITILPPPASAASQPATRPANQHNP